MSLGEPHLATRRRKSSETSRTSEPHTASESNKDASTPEKFHYPFITKVQIRIKQTETELSKRQSAPPNNNRSSNGHRIRSMNLEIRENSARSTPISTDSYYQRKSSSSFHLYQESRDERRRRRREMLGERASAPYVEREIQDRDTLLYRPRIRAEDCGVQLLLVRELTNHLNCASRNTQSAKRSNYQRPTVTFRTRATKGEEQFGIGK